MGSLSSEHDSIRFVCFYKGENLNNDDTNRLII